MNFQTAYQRALLCDLAYTDAATPIGPHHAIVGPIGFEGNETIVAFRGTKTFKEWLLDARALPVRSLYWPGLVHSGFAEALQTIWTELVKLLPKPDREQPPVVHFTGHSLGADLAIGAAYRLAGSPLFKVGSVHLFAPAEFGSDAFRAEYNRKLGAQTYAFVNHNDIVPALPPWWMAGHVGELYYADSQGRMWDKVTDRSLEHLTWDDHHMEHYVRVLGNAAAKEAMAAAA